MKSYKRTAALLLLAAMMLNFAGCADSNTEGTEVTETSETTVETSETTVETSEETVVESIPNNTAPTSLSYSDNFSDAQTSYDAYVEFVDAFMEGYEGEVLFRYATDYYHRSPRWVLNITYPDLEMTEVYECVDGEVNYVGTLDYLERNSLPYEMFSALPCMCDFFSGSTVTEMPDPTDGRYFGSIVAAAVDGSSVLLLIGDPIILTEEEYSDLEIGDVIDCPPMYDGEEPGMTVTDILDSGRNRYVQLDNGTAECWFVQGSYTEDPTDYILMTSSDNPVWLNPRLVLVSLADNCDVSDTYSFLFSNGDDSQFDGWNTDPDANAFTSSVYWYYETSVQLNPPEVVNGWVPADGLVYPVVIENGEVTSINIEWR